MQGVLTVREAQARGLCAGLDLVEISPNADPPVCKVLGLRQIQIRAAKEEERSQEKAEDRSKIKEVKVRPEHRRE